MASSNLNDICFICLNQLLTGPECKADEYRNLNDSNFEIIERFANAWKEQGSTCYNDCINMCQKYKEQKKTASFHVTCYRKLLSNATYLDECKKMSQATTVKENEKDEIKDTIPDAAPSIPDSTHDSSTTSNSSQTSEIEDCDTDTLPQAARILRENLLKLPNGIYNDYTDDPLVYMFFSSLCGGDEEIPSSNEELNKKILFLCQEFATAVHKHQHEQASDAAEEDMLYLGSLVMKTVLSTSD